MDDDYTADRILLPIESLALTMALNQYLRGDSPDEGVATVCVLALARLTGKHDWTKDQDGAA